MPAINPFHAPQNGIHDPFPGVISVTPSDTEELPQVIRGLMVGEAGNVAVTMLDGSEATLPALQPGVQYVGMFRQVHATSTTATGIIGFK